MTRDNEGLVGGGVEAGGATYLGHLGDHESGAPSFASQLWNVKAQAGEVLSLPLSPPSTQLVGGI